MICPRCGEKINKSSGSCKYCKEEVVVENAPFLSESLGRLKKRAILKKVIIPAGVFLIVILSLLTLFILFH